MKKLLQGFLTFTIAALACNHGFAAVYTTATSGNFTTGATWAGGIVPPTTVSGIDTIIVSNGHTLTLNHDLEFTHAQAYLNVQGTLTGTGYAIMIAPTMEFEVAGDLSVDSMVLGNGGHGELSGRMDIGKLRAYDFSFSGQVSINIIKELYVHGNLISNGTKLLLRQGSVINMLGGTFTGMGGILASGAYDVVYAENGYMHDAGTELMLPIVRNITIDVAAREQVRLVSDLTVKGILTLQSGSLALNGHNLKIEGDGTISQQGSGVISSFSPSAIHIENKQGIPRTLTFKQGSSLSFLVINPATPSVVRIGSNLRITDGITLTNGKIEIVDSTIRLVTGATVTGASIDRYIITTGKGNLSADIGANNTVAFHIGAHSGYAPVVVTSRNGTVYNGLSARVMNGVKTMADYGKDLANSQPVVDGTWVLQHSGTADVNVEVSWPQSWERGVFDRNISYLTNFMVHYWDKTLGSGAQAGPEANMFVQKRNFNTLGYFAVFDNNTVGVNNIASEVSAKVYPNPVNDVLNISMTLKQTEEFTISLRDVTGRTLSQLPQQQYSAGSHTVQLPVQGLAAGVYMYTITGADGITRSTGRVVKQ